MAKLHIRHMVGGHGTERRERLFRFEFPERPGALLNFLDKLGSRWNISLFHYRNHGAADGRVLAGLQVPDEERAASWRRRCKPSAIRTGRKPTTRPTGCSPVELRGGAPAGHALSCPSAELRQGYPPSEGHGHAQAQPPAGHAGRTAGLLGTEGKGTREELAHLAARGEWSNVPAYNASREQIADHLGKSVSPESDASFFDSRRFSEAIVLLRAGRCCW